MRYVIIGGVAAGAGAAARLRRLDETAGILLLERGDYISYANCGLPYHIGGAIEDRDELLVLTPEAFAARFAVDVRVRHEAVSIERAGKTVAVRGPDGAVRREAYDKLLLATGSSPILPALPGADDPRVTPLWTIPDMDRIKRLARAGAKAAVVVGGGFIGLETAENLLEAGLAVTLAELMPQLLPTLDREMAGPLAAEARRLGIGLELGRKVTAFRPGPDGLAVVLDDGREIRADIVVVSIGVRPNSELAAAAGLELGKRGHIAVDEFLRTSDPDIYAAGDAVETADPLLGGRTAVQLAGPANKQARIAADNMAGRTSRYRGGLGTSVIKLGGLAAAGVGHTERRLRELGVEYRKIYLHPPTNAAYYPGSSRLHMKLVFSPDGKIYGAQITGAKGVDKRIDVIAAAMTAGLDAGRLAELELAYAPSFSSAKDPVNLAGMIAANILDGDSVAAQADSLPAGAVLLDVREPEEVANGTIPGSMNIPLGELRGRTDEIPKGRTVVAFCQIGFRGYVAERILRQRGFAAMNLSGGYATWRMFQA